jgi:hypothetical protein
LSIKIIFANKNALLINGFCLFSLKSLKASVDRTFKKYALIAQAGEALRDLYAPIIFQKILFLGVKQKKMLTSASL